MKAFLQPLGSLACASATQLGVFFALSLAPLASGQSLIAPADFFDPDFRVAPQGVSGLNAVTLGVTLTPVTASLPPDGNVTWSHSAGGLVQTRVLSLIDIRAANHAETIGNSLVFGRTLDVDVLGVDAFNLVPGLTNNLLNTSVAGSWSSTATVANLGLSQGVLYSASFNVTVGGAVLDIDLFESANFTLLNGNTPIANIDSDLTLNLLDILAVGAGAQSFSFEFYAPAGLDDLGFRFELETIADVSLLGALSESSPQVMMEVTNFSLAPVPEPGSLFLASFGLLALLRRRRLLAH